MKIRKAAPLMLVLAAGGVSSPVLADCCSGWLSCAATVVTYGVSCEIQTLIDTLTSIGNMLTNFIHDLTGQTQDAERQARQSVTDTYNAMQSQSQQSSSDLAAALSQAQVIAKDESTIREIKEKTVVNQNLLPNSASTNSSPPTGPVTLSTQEQSHLASNANAKAAGGPPLAMRTQANPSLATAAAPAAPTNPMLQKSTVLVGTQISASDQMTTTPYGAFNDAFSRAVKQITLLKNAGDSDMNKVNQYLAQAQSSEGPGVAQADTLSGLMMSPLTALSSEISSMLENPLNAFDPTSAVDAMENQITADMSVNVSKMIDAITTGPDQAFTAAQPTYDDLLANAESAQAISAAMTRLYQQRSTAAATALYELLPKTEYAGLNNKATVQATVASHGNQATTFGKRLPFAAVSARLATAKKSALLAYKKPNTSQLHAAIAQFKAQRATGKSPLPQATLAGYQSNLTQQLNGYLNGKSVVAIANQRDQLIAQARTKYARDPATANGIIALLNQEAAKRGGASNAAAANLAVPGQPVPRVTAPAAMAAPSFASGSVRQPVAVVAPVNPPLNQTKTPTWGASPSAWTPAAAPAATLGHPATTTGAATSFKPATTLTTAQPIQQMQQPAMQAAPSSLGH